MKSAERAIFPDPDFAEGLRAVCEDLGYRNRIIVPPVAPMIGPNQCQCGNLLTIEDYGTSCRQCVLGGRLAEDVRRRIEDGELRGTL